MLFPLGSNVGQRGHQSCHPGHRYVFVSGEDDGDSGSGGGAAFTRDPSLRIQPGRLNRPAIFVCPIGSKTGSIATCTFYGPDNQEYVLLGRQVQST